MNLRKILCYFTFWGIQNENEFLKKKIHFSCYLKFGYFTHLSYLVSNIHQVMFQAFRDYSHLLKLWTFTVRQNYQTITLQHLWRFYPLVELNSLTGGDNKLPETGSCMDNLLPGYLLWSDGAHGSSILRLSGDSVEVWVRVARPRLIYSY